MKIKNLLLLCIFITLQFVIVNQASALKLSGYFLGGYSFAVNESYVDTHKNKDIYWNPNSGWSFRAGIIFALSERFDLRIDIDGVFGYYKYGTDDGGKVNTESQAGNNPPTTNTEWSQSFNFHIMLIAKIITRGKFLPYFGIGAGIGILQSYETWEFKNADGDNAKVFIRKYYPIALSFKGVVGFVWKIMNKLGLMLEASFTLVNFVMSKVIINKYTINGVDHTDDYTLGERTYTYQYDIEDENKGGDCLLAGFNYSNYPQQKISTVFSVQMGVFFQF